MTSDDHSQLKNELESVPDKLSQPWGTKSQLIEALRDRLIQIKTAAPEDPYDRAKYFARNKGEPWYIRTAMKYARHVEKCVEQGRVWEAVSFTYDVSELVTELGFKMDFEKSALTGAQLLNSQGKGAKARRQQSDLLRYERVLEYVDKGHSVRRAFTLVAKQFGVSASTIKRDYYAVKKRSNADRLEQ